MNEKNTLNFTFNFHAPVGQNIAHVDKLEAHFDKDMTMQVVDTATLAREEMHLTRGLWEAMTAVGYREKQKLLSRSQVKTIVTFLGEP